MFFLRKHCILLSVCGFLYLAAIMAVGLLAKPVASDLAVVLGNEVLANGKPSARLAARLDCAVNLYRRHLARFILVSGGKEKSGFDEASVMRQYLIDWKIPTQDIFTDSEGVNTQATAINAAKLFHAKHFSRIIIVTQAYHIARSMLAFHRAGIHSLSADHPDYFELADFFAIAREGVALPVYFAKMPGND